MEDMGKKCSQERRHDHRTENEGPLQPQAEEGLGHEPRGGFGHEPPAGYELR